MYMIAGLCMLKLYQKRHPDINASAYSAYACLAVVIFFSVLGVVRPRGGTPAPEAQPGATRPSGGRVGAQLPRLSPPVALQVFGKGNTVFWVVFSVIHIVATLLLSIQLYYMGRWKLGERVPGQGVGGLWGSALRRGLEGHWESRQAWAQLRPQALALCGEAGQARHASPPADSGICRRILHVIYTDCVRQCSGPLYVVPPQPRPSALFPGEPTTAPPVSLPVSPAPCLCFPPGPHGAAGHGQHYQLVAVSLATVCGSLAGWTAGNWQET